MPENEELWYLVLHYKEQKQTVSHWNIPFSWKTDKIYQIS